MNQHGGSRHRAGFTVVELLIVIVVIGILAAITIVAYSGIQSKAKDAQTDSALSQLKGGLELYNANNGFYPNACGADDAGCAVSLLGSYLVPTYISTLPTTSAMIGYVRGSGANTSYAINVDYIAKPDCKTGVGVNPGWWGSALPTC